VSVLLGGCSQSPDTTAVVNGVVIRESTLDDMARALVSSGAMSDYKEARNSAFNWVLGGEVARQLASTDGITLTPVDIATVSASSPNYATFLNTPIGVQYATDQLNMRDFANQVSDWQTQYADVNVDLNPRYGSWTDLVAGSFSTSPTGSLSVVSGS
jgi:phage-related tail fiber protein